MGPSDRQKLGFYLKHRLWGLQPLSGEETQEGAKETTLWASFVLLPLPSLGVFTRCAFGLSLIYVGTGSHCVFLFDLELPSRQHWPWSHRDPPTSASCLLLFEKQI